MGLAWKYYNEERDRYKDLDGVKGTFEEYCRAIKKLCRHFKLRLPSIRKTSGCRHSCANDHRVTLNMDWASWRTVYHELAHTMHDQNHFKYDRPGVKPQWHGKVHRKLMARICRYAVKKGWHLGSLKKPEAITPQPTVLDERAQQMAVEIELKADLEKRIDRRERQVKRLTSRIKALSTRLSRATRSLSALQRSYKKKYSTERMAAEVQ